MDAVSWDRGRPARKSFGSATSPMMRARRARSQVDRHDNMGNAIGRLRRQNSRAGFALNRPASPDRLLAWCRPLHPKDRYDRQDKEVASGSEFHSPELRSRVVLRSGSLSQMGGTDESGFWQGDSKSRRRLRPAHGEHREIRTSPRRPSRTMRIFSSAVNLRRVAFRI